MGDLPTNPSVNTPRRVDVIDCTLRDGEQAAGVWFSVEEKVALALALSRAGVVVLDAGFPASSPADLEAMLAMRAEGVTAKIGATARPVRGDIEAARRARADEVFLFMPTSDLRLEQTLKLSCAEAREQFRESAAQVVDLGLTLNLVCEDATRADIGHLLSMVDRVRERAAIRRLVLADTVGCATPTSMGALIQILRAAVDDDEIDITPHCHNDFGLATANTCAAVMAGARSVTCTVNGIGERAGNADLAETIAALSHLHSVGHDIDPAALPLLSKMVERFSGVRAGLLKPVTGYNVYRHESGIHVDGMLKTRESYEFLPAAWTKRESEFVLGKHSGVGSIRHILQTHELEATPEELRALLQRVKEFAVSRSKSGTTSEAAGKEGLSGVPPDFVIEQLQRLRTHLKGVGS